MKLLIATGLYPPEIGGPATYTVFLEKHLPRFGIAYDVLPYTTVRKYPKIIRHLVYLVKIIRRARRADVLYALDTVSVGFPVLLASILTRTPYLLRVPGDYAWEQGQQKYGVTEALDTFHSNGKYRAQVRVLMFIQRLVARNAVRVIVPSEYMKTIVRRWGVHEEKITRIYSALKVIEVGETKDELRRKFGIDGCVVATAGRLVPWKGMRALIDTVHALHLKGKQITLNIIGNGVCRTELEHHIKEINAEGYIHLLGALKREDMARHIKAADIFVLNTAYEGLSHQLIEVMSIGTPIITTPVGGNTELIENEKTGLFVTYNNSDEMETAIERMYDDVRYGEQLSKNALGSLHKFHEDVVIEEFGAFLKTLSL